MGVPSVLKQGLVILCSLALKPVSLSDCHLRLEGSPLAEAKCELVCLRPLWWSAGIGILDGLVVVRGSRFLVLATHG